MRSIDSFEWNCKNYYKKPFESTVKDSEAYSGKVKRSSY